jgi:hypothetical protein
MKTPFEPHQWLSVSLSAVALLLCAVLYWEWMDGRRLEQDLSQLRKVPVTPISVQAVLPEFVLPDAGSGFPELLSRSLFTNNRRSVGGATKGGQTAMKKGQFALVGVMVSPSQSSALLRDVQTNKTEAVAAGGVVRGMTLGDVAPGKVVLRQGGDSEELILNVQTGAKVVPPGGSAPGTPSPTPTASAKAPAPPVSAPAGGASAPTREVAPKPAQVASAPKLPNAPPPAAPGSSPK